MKHGDKVVIKSTEAMREFATHWVSSLVPKKNTATIYGLVGDLGAGKTTFVQGVAKALGITESLTSPTFVIQKSYMAQKVFTRLVHIDAYRLHRARELEVLGFSELLKDPHTLILIEWPEQVQYMNQELPTLTFTWVSEHERTIAAT